AHTYLLNDICCHTVKANRNWLRSTTALCGSLAAILLALAQPALANPQGGVVAGGTVTITQTSPTRVDINQGTTKGIVNWQSFSIGSTEHTNFNQPNAQAITLNRVVGGNLSEILGRLTANGQVWLINPNGVFFGPGARIDVGGLLATTHDIKNEDFMAGRYIFQSDSQPPGIIENQGVITAAEAGLVAFVAPGVVNHGVITARLGEVTLASGNAFVVDFYGDQKINLVMDRKTSGQVIGRDGKPLDALVKNDGQVFADGGRVQMSAAAAKGVVENVISLGGLVQARSVQQKNGKIILSGDQGNVLVTGTIDASGRNAGESGGKVTISGAVVTIASTGKVDASGDISGGQVVLTADSIDHRGVILANSTTGSGGIIDIFADDIKLVAARLDTSGATSGGAIRIGGDVQGGNASDSTLQKYGISLGSKPVRNARKVVVDNNSVINANATLKGRGGKVVVWSDGSTSVNGIITAMGGIQGGDGGFVETSGHALSVGSSARITTGEGGNWLLDPTEIIVSNTGGTITATSIQDTLNGGTVVTLSTTGGGVGNGDITINSPISWSTSNALILDAYRGVQINAVLTASGTTAGLTVTYNHGGSGGNLLTGAGASVTLSGASAALTINNVGYKLISTASDLQNSIASNGYGIAYALATDINMTGFGNFTPIGFNGSDNNTNPAEFTGSFDGLGHTVTGLTINNPAANYLGLFSIIGSGATVRNLGLVGGSVTGGAVYGRFGMHAGTNYGTITNAYATGAVSGGSGASYIGGLVGYSSGGAISSSYAT
ncbi:MAG: filamentous hemagglutinin N-terminal domain-containing protein, partial [Rhodospirillaceae bacterium]